MVTDPQMLKINPGLNDKFKLMSVRQNAFVIGTLFTLSRIIGTLRESVISRFVTRDIYDMYTLAVKIPSMIRRLSSEGTLENAYVPSLNQFSQEEQVEASTWLSRVATVILLFSAIIVYAFIITIDFWSPALLKQKYDILHVSIFKNLFTIILPIILLYFLSSTFIAVLHKHEKFVHANLGQSIANVFMVSTAYIGYRLTNSYLILALSTLSGAVMHLAWQYYGVCKLNKCEAQSVNRGFLRIVLLAIALLLITVLGLAIGDQVLNILYSQFPDQYVLGNDKRLFIKIMLYTVLFAVFAFGIHSVIRNTTQMMPDKNGLQYGKLDFGPDIKLKYSFAAFLSRASKYLLPVLLFTTVFFKSNLIIWPLLAVYIIRNALINAFRNCFPLFRVNRYGYLFLSVFAFIYPKLFLFLHLINKFVYLCRYQLTIQGLNPKVTEVNRRFLGTARNAFFGTGIHQIMSAVSIAVSAKLGAGAPSYMNRADRIMQFPIGILGVSFGIALLPRITHLLIEGKVAEANRLYRSVFITSMSLCIVVIILSFLITEPLVKLFFLGGQTNLVDVKIICLLFKIEVLGLPASVILKTLYPIYFGLNTSHIITRAAVIQCFVDVSLKLTLLKFGLGVEWMAFSWVIGSWVSAIYLFWYRVTKLKTKVPSVGFEPTTC